MSKFIIAGMGDDDTPGEILALMEKIAAQVAAARGYVRTGHGNNADMALQKGAGKNSLVYLPCEGFGPEERHAPARNYRLFDQVPGRSRYLARNSWMCKEADEGEIMILGSMFFQVMGEDGNSPVKALIFWEKDYKEDSPDAHSSAITRAAKTAQDEGIPAFNMLKVPGDQILMWFKYAMRLEQPLEIG